jgi:hypothetical protein
MTLHKAVELIKKVGIGTGIGLSIIMIFFIVIKIGSFMINIITPPKITPPNIAFDNLPAIQFPENVVDNEFTYTLNTLSGSLPTDFPDRLHIYSIEVQSASLLNLDKAKTKAYELGFRDQQGKVLPEISLGNGKYLWEDNSDLSRKLIFDILNFNFSITSSYLANLTVLGAQNISDENNAIQTANELLESVELLPSDIAIEKTQTPQDDANYNTYPKLFTIRNGALVPTTSLSSAKVIRVDFYQKDIEYDLDTGHQNAPKAKMKLPIRYPKPPFSTMSFWIASGQNSAEVGAAEFVHHNIIIPSDTPATYPIKKVEDAFEELKSGKAYIAAYQGLDQEILISNVYLAYYLGADNPSYLMPIIVFEGQNSFFAYVSAVTDDFIN